MNNTTKKKEGAYASLTGFRRAVPIILVALALFIGLCFIIKDTGALGNFMSDVLLGLFSIGGYFIPFFLAVHAFFYPSDHVKKRTVTRVVFTALAIITISAVAHTITNFGDKITFSAKGAYVDGTNNVGGGFIGALISFLLTKIFGTVGVIIIAALLFALYITYFFSGSRSALSRLLLRILNAISDFFASRPEKKNTRKQKSLDKKEEKKRYVLASEQELLTDDEFFAADNGMQELKIEELGIHEIRDKRELEKNPHLQEKVFRKNTTSETSRQRYYTSSDYEEPHRERKINTDYSTTDSVHGLYDNVGDTKYSPKPDDIIYDSREQTREKSAEEFFSAGFEPFDVKINEELSKKPSSKTEKANAEPEGISEFTEPISTINPEDIEKARQRADFEMKKRATAEAQRIYAEARMQDAERNYSGYSSNTEFVEKTEQNEPYIPEYMEEKKEESFGDGFTAEEENEIDARRAESFRSAMGDYERERDMEFKPYEPHIEEPAAYSEKEEEDELKITRTILDPYPTQPDEEQLYSDEDEDSAELDFSEADEAAEDFEDEKIPPEMQNPNVIMQRQMFSFLEEEDKEQEDNENEFSEPVSDEETEEALPPLTQERPRPVFEPVRKPPEPKEEEPKPEKPDYSDYQYPPLDLLLKGKFEEDTNQEEEKNRNAEILVDTLAQFNVRVSIKGVDRGPRITRYEIVPAKGIKVSKVMALYNDIALNLGVDGMRMEAPIPGKSAIGVEIPNKHPTTVLLRDLVESDEFIRSSSKTYACLGKDVTGNPVFADIAKMPHVLVAGATGMGKSVCINAILISILYKARPDEVKFIMIDPKKVEFNGYNGIPHLLVPVVTDVKQAAGTLMWAVEQMEKRYDLMEALEVKKLDDYNQKVKENPSLGEPLPKIIIVIDELNDIMLQVRKPAEDLIMSIAQKARAAGIHLIIGTQRPSVDVITGIIKANIPSRISCKVASLNDSRTILEQVGAEKLLNNGDMLYVSAGAPKALRVQGAFVSDPEVIGVMKFLKAQAKGAIYDSEALEEINRAAQKCSKNKGEDDGFDGDEDSDNVGILNDQQFLDAVELAIRSSKISTSLIQRKIGIGYGKAAKFIDNMENLGIVSEPNGSKPRDILITKDEWHEMLARRSLD